MKSIIDILPLFLLLIATPAISSIVFAQNNTSNSTANGTGTGGAGGGLSANSVNIAKSNSKDLTENSTANGTGTGGAGGGLSTK